MSKLFTTLIVVLTTLSISTLPLLSVTWKFIPNAEIENNRFKETASIGDTPILKFMDSKGKGYSLVEFNNNQFKTISTTDIEQKIDNGSQMFSFESQIFVATGKNSILKLDEGYNWKTLELDDKYNQQNNKFMRVTKKIVDYDNKLYCLSEAWDVKLIDTNAGGVIAIVVDEKYNELISLNDEKLNIEFSKEAGTGERFYDIIADGNSLWISSSNLLRYEDGEIKEEIDIYNTLDFDSNIILRYLTVDDDYVYLLKQATNQGTKNVDAFLIRYEKSSGVLEKITFPDAKSYDGSGLSRKAGGFTNMIIENDIIYISTNAGLYEFSNNELKYIDIFSEFLNDLPSVFLQYLNSENVSIVGKTIYISTNVGLIYSDDFTSTSGVNITKANVGLDIYPNVITGSQNSLTIESTESKDVNSVIIYNIEGTEVYNYTNTPKHLIGSMTLEVPNLSSGSYFIAVRIDKDNFISPLVIQK